MCVCVCLVIVAMSTTGHDSSLHEAVRWPGSSTVLPVPTGSSQHGRTLIQVHNIHVYVYVYCTLHPCVYTRSVNHMYCTCTVYTCFNERREGRKKETNKVKQTTRQSNTTHPRQSLFLIKMSCLGWDSNHLYMYSLVPRLSRLSLSMRAIIAIIVHVQ